MIDRKRYIVDRIKNEDARPFVLKKHYAKRMPNVKTTFGLFDKNVLIGCCLFGYPPCYNLNNIGKFNVLELQRLVVESEEKNITSYFVSKSLNMLDKPSAIVSYADTGQNHYGYIYQATNWVYTGMSSEQIKYTDGCKVYHKKTLSGRYGNAIENELKKYGFKKVMSSKKHRYFYLLGTKKQKKEMLELIKDKYEILPYPKGESKRYDASTEVHTQMRLF